MILFDAFREILRLSNGLSEHKQGSDERRSIRQWIRASIDTRRKVKRTRTKSQYVVFSDNETCTHTKAKWNRLTNCWLLVRLPSWVDLSDERQTGNSVDVMNPRAGKSIRQQIRTRSYFVTIQVTFPNDFHSTNYIIAISYHNAWCSFD